MMPGIKFLDRRLLISVFSVALYVAIFILMTYTPGRGMAIATIIPIVIIAWCYGTWAGIGAAVLGAPVNIALCFAVGIDWMEKFYVGGVGLAGTLIEILIGAVVGKLHDYNRRIQDELALRTALESELQQHRTRLEEMVQAKTAELEASNRLLTQSRLEIQRARDHFETLFKTSPDAIFVTDSDGYVTMANDSVYDVYGYRPDEIVGQHASILTPDDEKSWQQSIALIDEVFEKRLVRSRLATRIRKDGRIIEVETSVALQENADGGPMAAISSSRDISDRKRLEEQIRQAHKMEAIGTLAGGIAHDFNNILGAIIGFTELSLHLPADDAMMKDNLSQVLKASERAKELVKQILVFSRAGTAEPRPVQMHLVIREALGLLRSLIPATIDIQTDVAAARDIVIADATQLQQIVMNLCANAGHAMRLNGGVLTLKLSAVDIDAMTAVAYADLPPGPYVQLSVKDTGTGIHEDIAARIFEPFFTTKPVGEGTGMGLAVVHGIVKSLKGDIKMYSEPGRGTVFHVLLPRAEETAGHDDDLPARSAPRGDERVLLVDDEPALRDVGSNILASLGYRVTTAANAAEALELFGKDPAAFDVVITDQTMPGLTGYELAQRLMSLRADIPVILCTGYSDTVTADAAMAGGVRAFIMKPLNRLSLAETLRSAFDVPASASAGS